MQYVLFLGIFGLPIAVCVGLLATRILDAFASDELPARGPLDASQLDETESRERELVETFFSSPAGQAPPATPS